VFPACSDAVLAACHLERESPRTSRKVPTGLGARISRRFASVYLGTFRLRGLGGRSAQGDMWGALCCAGGGSLTASWSPGLLVRLRRPSVARSAWSCGGQLRDCDRADRTPAASLVAWRDAPERSTARVARQRHCVDRAALPDGRSGTMACPARLGVRHRLEDPRTARPGVAPYARALGGGLGTPGGGDPRVL